ncbi:GNAT family N-acetyltransferase [Streptomyces sp. SM10]|uniref:GNAT family N-acetyltransferase n=1 Tax=Streptomyces sp. SM10 TaxID=565556 RepID=UPI000CD55650|nr:GNAT family N-acetyltransferase [Streptomyces sp. SM10]
MNDAAANLRFVPLDAGDPATLEAWLRLTTDGADDVPLSAAPPCAADLVGSVRFAPPDTVLAGEVAFLGGQAVGAVRLVLPDRAPVAVVDQLLTAPKERRQGIGTALVRRARALAGEHGRTLLVADLVQALPGGPARDGGPAAFAAAVGAAPAEGPEGVHQWLDLARHDPLAGGIPEVPAGYRLQRWGTITPDGFAVAVSELGQSLGASGPESWDQGPEAVRTSHVRRYERMRVGRGRRAYHVGVVHEETGELAGFTSASKTTGNPEHLLQGMTVVAARHRGHGLGLLMKLANLAHVREYEPLVKLIETANADDNRPMIALNEAMGFVPQERFVSWEAPVAPAV